MTAVELLVADLGTRLRGPRCVRMALLREVDDGLQDAAEAYREEGLAPEEAARRAADDFGDPADLAPAYQAELDACQGRRAAMLIAVAYPALTVIWDALWRFAGIGDGKASPDVASVASVLDLVSYGSAIAAAATIPFFARGSAATVRRLALSVGILGWVTLVNAIGMSVWLSEANGASGAQEMSGSAAALAVLVLTAATSLAIAKTSTFTLLRVSRAVR